MVANINFGHTDFQASQSYGEDSNNAAFKASISNARHKQQQEFALAVPEGDCPEGRSKV
jgi:hypothetical protein